MHRLLLLALAASPVTVDAAEWTRFRGPDGMGYGEGPAVPFEFGDSTNLAWKARLPGAGSSSPVVTGGRVFLTCYTGSGGGRGLARQVVCLDLGTGKPLWQREVESQRRDDPYQGYLTEHGYASNTPVTDGERLFVFLGKSGVLAYDLQGNQLWRVDVGEESSNREWGSAASPTLYKNTVIVNASEEGRAIVALDKATGAEVWKTETSSLELCYNTPTLGKAPGGRDELIVPTPGEVWSLNPDTGKLRWYAAVPLDGNVSPSALVADGVAYVYGGRSGGAAAIRLGGRGDVTDSHTLWTARDSSYVATPLLHQGRLYWASDRGMAFCVDAQTGKTITRRRLKTRSGGRPVYASPVLSGDRIIVPSRYDGVFIFSATPEFETLRVNPFAGDESQFNATPAIVDGKLLIRSDAYLYCVASQP
ncbi:MAG: PQQ-binding-like beta-propeller repeat protein [Planctomycetota bacterium]